MDVETIAAAAAIKVVSTTTIASSLNASTLPGLKPNHPTQSRRMAMVNQPTGEVDHPKFGEPSTRIPDPCCRQRPDGHEVDDRIDGKGGQLHLVQRDHAYQRQRDRGKRRLE